MNNSSKSNIFRRAFLLGLPFLLLYFVIRNIPVKPCDFLHEETYNLEGELDFCGPGDAEFVDLSIRKWPMKMDFKAIDTPVNGKKSRFEINIKQFDGSPLGPDDVALSHTQKIHLLAIDESLQDYQHLHPVADELFDGTWRFSMEPKFSGQYKFFLDFIPLRSPRRVLLASSFQVEGNQQPDLDLKPQLTAKDGNNLFSLDMNNKPKVGSEITLELKGQDNKGRSLSLSPVMGAFAHMVAFDRTLKGFAHLHPSEDSLPSSIDDLHSGALVFRFVPPAVGTYRLWAQLKVKDQDTETLIPFDLVVDS